jgi:hypothetical protein
MVSPMEPIRLTLEVQAGPDASPEEVDQVTRQLLEDLRQMEIDSADLVSAGPAPDGTKAVDPVTLGAIAVAVLPTLLPKVVDFVQAWSQRGQGRSVKFKGKIGGQAIEFEGPADELKALIANLSSQAHPNQPVRKST